MKNMDTQQYLLFVLIMIAFGLCLFVIMYDPKQEKIDIKITSDKKDTKIDSLESRIYKLEYRERFYIKTKRQDDKLYDGLRDKYIKAFNLLSKRNKLKFDLGRDTSPAFAIDPHYDIEEIHKQQVFHNLMMDDSVINIRNCYLPNTINNGVILKGKRIVIIEN